MQLEKTVQNLIRSGRKAVSKFEWPETQSQWTVREKKICKTYL